MGKYYVLYFKIWMPDLKYGLSAHPSLQCGLLSNFLTTCLLLSLCLCQVISASKCVADCKDTWFSFHVVSTQEPWFVFNIKRNTTLIFTHIAAKSLPNKITFTLLLYPQDGCEGLRQACLFVCLLAYLRNHTAELHQIFLCYVHVACGCGLFYSFVWHCYTLCTSSSQMSSYFHTMDSTKHRHI